MLDLHLQYALHTTSFAEQPISDKTLSRFCKRCYDYETLYGVDLYHDCVKDLSDKIAKVMKLNGRIRRMDSMMIESNIRFLSRMELIYNCISKLVIYFSKVSQDKISEELKHYADLNDYNRIFYHQRNDDMEAIIQMLLTDSEKLLDICKTEFEEVTEYQLFARCLSEYAVVENDKGRLCTKEDGTMNSSALQNTSGTDATYRNKAGKLHRGYSLRWSMKNKDFSFYLSRWFQEYLPFQEGCSTNTIKSYRDAFCMLLGYLQEYKDIIPNKVTFSKINKQII